MKKTVPLPKLPDLPQTYVDTVTMGPQILPIERIRLYSGTQWEELVHEWAEGLKSRYWLVERCAGAGDMGRDIVAYPDENDNNVWDNYQCKHYEHPLRPSEIWIELGKLVYYTFRNEFTYPRKYWFVAPQGAGTSLARLLRNPEQLRENLIENWDKYCKTEITSTEIVPLTADLLAYLKELDFTIFGYIPPLRLIDEHRSTPYYLVRFGGALPPRQDCPAPPDVPALTEMAYLRKLFGAYGDHLKCDVQGPSDIEVEQDLKDHYADSRIEFYSAESLRNFSRDTLPEGEYEKLQDEVHDGIRDVIRGEHDDGYRRVVAVVGAAKSLQLTSHALLPRIHVKDRGGICHQLANDRDNVKWVK